MSADSSGAALRDQGSVAIKWLERAERQAARESLSAMAATGRPS